MSNMVGYRERPNILCTKLSLRYGFRLQCNIFFPLRDQIGGLGLPLQSSTIIIHPQSIVNKKAHKFESGLQSGISDVRTVASQWLHFIFIQ